MGLQENFIPFAAIAQESSSETQPVVERLKKARGLVIFDLDKTAIDINYQTINLLRLQKAIERLQNHGVLVGIHSDSPRETEIQFAEQFGQLSSLQGPLIYEMAAMHFQPENLDFVLDPESMAFFQKFRKEVYNSIQAAFPDQPDIRNLISMTTDRNREIREQKSYPEYTNGIGVWINPFRRNTFGLWDAQIGPDGNTKLDSSLHNKVDRLIRQMLLENLGVPTMEDALKIIDYDSNEEYGVIIVKSKELSTKTRPVQAVLTLLNGRDIPIAMIGDSVADYIDDPRVTTFAVGNAKDELKTLVANQQAKYFTDLPKISQGEFTDGLSEHLEHIAGYFEIPN